MLCFCLNLSGFASEYFFLSFLFPIVFYSRCYHVSHKCH
jgi:hypothetical protein